MLTQKETNLLQDMKSSEQLCVERYDKLSCSAKDPQLKNLFTQLRDTEQQHFDTVSNILNGEVPSMNGTGCSQKEPSSFKAVYDSMSNSDDKNEDKFLCMDALSSEKYVSSVYNTNIFEFKNEEIRHALNHIQKEEQHHGKLIYDYMNTNGLY